MLEIRKQQKRVLTIIIILFFLLIASLIITTSLVDDFDLSLTLCSVALIVIFIALSIFKKKHDDLTLSYKYQALFENLEPAIKASKSFLSETWVNDLIADGYIKYKETGSFTILYNIKEGFKPHKFYKTLYVIVVIKDEELSFEHPRFIREINDLEDKMAKKRPYKQRIIYQFKSGTKFEQEKVKSTNNVLFINRKSLHLILINTYYFNKDQIAFFPHSNNYPPTHYYKFASDYLITLIK